MASTRGGSGSRPSAFVYQPHADAGATYEWDETAKSRIKDHDPLDLSI